MERIKVFYLGQYQVTFANGETKYGSRTGIFLTADLFRKWAIKTIKKHYKQKGDGNVSVQFYKVSTPWGNPNFKNN